MAVSTPGLWAQNKDEKSAPNITPEEILDKIDKNMVFKSAHTTVDMVIKIKKRTIKKQMESWSVGNERSFIKFLSPARDKGTKMLKTGKVVKIFYPSAERIVRLSGHLLRQSMMGSDFSYEDMTERSKKLREEYKAEIKGEETFKDTPCYLLVLTSKVPKQTYFTRKTWIDKKRFIALKEELYAKSGKLLKVTTLEKWESIGKRYYPVEIIMEDKLRKNSQTRMVISKIEFDIDIPDSMFSERQLMK